MLATCSCDYDASFPPSLVTIRPNPQIQTNTSEHRRMMHQRFDRVDPKRRNTIHHKKKQFADASYKQQEYPHRLNFYEVPPIAEITLEEFEQWAIDRLRGTTADTLRQFRQLTGPSSRRTRGMLISK